MLKLTNISKSFIQRGIVLNNLDLEVQKGDSIAITGPSGSGKTTLMNIIGLLDKPDTGEVIYNDEKITNLDPVKAAFYRNKNIGFVFQDHLLLPHLTVQENIYLPLLASKKRKYNPVEKDKYIHSLMENTGIVELKNKFPYQISGGEAQRVTLIRALSNEPELLLADEPTGSLDSENADILGNLLVEMNNKLQITLLVVTHSTKLATKMKFIKQLENGKVNPV